MTDTEQSPWKVVIFGAGASLLLFILAFLILAPGNLDYFTVSIPEKVAQFKKLHVTGKNKGRLSYKLYAEEGWSTKKNNLTILKNVGPGSLYGDGTLTAKRLYARYVKVYRRRKKVEAFSQDPERPGQKPLLYVYLDLGKFAENNGKEKFTLVSAKQLIYFEKQKRSVLKDDVTIKEKNDTIFSPELEVDHENKNANFPKGLTLYRKNLTLKGGKAFFSSKKEKMEIEGNITLRIKDKDGTSILSCERLTLYSDPKKNLQAKGEIRVIQPKKASFSQKAAYNQDKNIITLKGEVKTIIEKFADILKEETIKSIDDPETKKSIKEKTMLKCDYLTIFTDTEDALAKGNVVVIQKGKEAKSNYGKYTDKNDQIVLTGNAYLKKGEEWVRAKKILISVKDETMEAMGKVESKFQITK